MVKDPIPTRPTGGPQGMQPLFGDFHDDEDMRPIVMMFLAEIPARIENLDRQRAASDRATFRRIVHQIKGAGGGYGFPSISEAASRLERCLDAAGPNWAQECHAHLDVLVTLLRRAHAGLAHMPQ
jgi:HPt (histidine-containing phosphotransfer) domain-containing protein